MKKVALALTLGSILSSASYALDISRAIEALPEGRNITTEVRNIPTEVVEANLGAYYTVNETEGAGALALVPRFANRYQGLRFCEDLAAGLREDNPNSGATFSCSVETVNIGPMVNVRGGNIILQINSLDN